jgi:hypothetical protein
MFTRVQSAHRARAYDRLVAMASGVQAAMDVAHQLGLHVEEPRVIQETHNTVVWLWPQPIIAKVGTYRDTAEGLIREHDVASRLSALNASVALPLPGSSPVTDVSSGFTVTLWCRVEKVEHVAVRGPAVGRSLDQLHRALGDCDVWLPSFRVGLEYARAALFDDQRVAALNPDDRMLLRSAFVDLWSKLDNLQFAEQALHGEPHDGNYLATASGLVWIDFESVCRGPREWDLAFLPEEALTESAPIDLALLQLLRVLNSVRVATWCAVEARFPEMRIHGEHHLRVVRSQWSGL